MKRRHFIGLLPILALGRKQLGAADPFAAEIAAFAAQDAAHRPDPGGIVFVGSSSIRLWKTLAEDFPGYPVINRGFGGAMFPDVNHHFDRVVAALKPRAVVLYVGDNDLAAGRRPDQVEDDFLEFARRVEGALAEAWCAFLAIKPSPSRVRWLPVQREANDRVRARIRTLARWRYVDVFEPLLDAQGKPEPLYFTRDRLHMNANGYAVWRRVIREWLGEIRFPVNGTSGTGEPRP